MVLISLIIVLSLNLAMAEIKQPHIIFILADDMGWNDVSFHGSDQIPTPNIDALGYNGIILNNHYVEALCTPSRSALLTGKYPIHTGMQHLVLLEPEPRGLPLSEKLLPEYLREVGYKNYLIGKWHLGFYRSEYLPTNRGFDSHFGYWNGLQDYFDHTVTATNNPAFHGLDIHRNTTPAFDTNGIYATDLYGDEAVKVIKQHNKNQPMFLYLATSAPHTGNQEDPLQAPDEEIAKFAHIKDPKRRVYAAMVSSLDKFVGKVITALRKEKMLDNSVIVFVSDNGAPTIDVHANSGSNYPLRGIKNSAFEGGIKTPSLIWSPLLKERQRVSQQLMHIVDWFPTLANLAGVNSSKLNGIDGLNMWPTLSLDKPSPRTEFLVNIDDIYHYASVRRGDWKYIIGSPVFDNFDDWLGETGRDQPSNYSAKDVLESEVGIVLTGFATMQQILEEKNSDFVDFKNKILTEDVVEMLRNQATLKCPKPNPEESDPRTICHPLKSPCLFNIKEDPCEIVNLASERPLIVQSLEESLARYRLNYVKESNVPIDPNAKPKYWGGVWSPWQDPPQQKSPVSVIVLVCIVGIFVVVAIVLLAITVQGWSFVWKKKVNFRHLFKMMDCKNKKDNFHNAAMAKESTNINLADSIITESYSNQLRTLSETCTK